MRSALLALAALTAPGFAQINLSGEWAPLFHEDQPERGQGPELGDYLGLPITEGARFFAESWDASRLTLQEHQCRVHISPYIYRGPLQLRIWEEKDPDTQQVIAIRNYISTYEQNRTIWMDGRPHPPDYAPHTWQGFSTGKWEGDILTVYTTHIKQGWIRRNGLPQSDQTTMVEHFIRHGDIMTHVAVITDPVYLTEPLVRSQDFQLNLRGGANWLWPCEYVVEVADRPKGEVPHYLPGKNAFMKEFPTRHSVPEVAALGGAETMYPEYNRAATAPVSRPMSSAPAAASDGEIHVLPVQGNVYMLVGAGGNIAVQTGPQGVLIVDSGLANMSDKVLAAVRKLSDKPIRYLLNTHVHPDHIGGNEAIARTGAPSTGLPVQGTPGSSASQLVQILAHENVLNRMSAAKMPAVAWPTDTFFNDEKEVYFNGEGVQMFHPSSKAHTDGDSIIYFRRSDVIVAGDLFITTGYPIIDQTRGGNVQGVIDGLNLILDLAIPAHQQEGGTYIISGHGRLCDEADVLEYRDMVTIIRDRVRDAMTHGMSLEQIKSAKLTRDYDARYGSSDTFVEAVYKSLQKP